MTAPETTPREVRTVFLVDDEPLVLRALARVLRAEGYQIQTFPSALKVLEALQESRPECLISDYYMPHMDGLALLHQVQETYPEVARVLLTGGHMDDHLHQALKQGVVQILIRKPWRTESLRELMEHVRQRHTGIFLKQWENERTPYPFPAVKPPEPEAPPPAPPMVADDGRPVVLVVDDQTEFCHLMEQWLQGRGFCPLSAATAELGLEILRSRRVDVVIADILMPDFSGIHLLKAVREMNPHLPVVAVTGMHDHKLVIDAFRAGASSFFYKPLDFSELEIVLRRGVDLGRTLSGAVQKPELAALLEVEHAIAGGLETPLLFDLLLQTLVRYTRAEAGSLLLLGADGRTLEMAASLGLETDPKKVKIEVGDRVAGWVVAHDEPQIVLGSDPEDNRLVGITRKRVPQVGLVLPMRGRERAIGAVCLTRFSSEEVFSRDDLELGLLLSSEVGRALEGRRARECHADQEREMLRQDKLMTLGEMASGLAHEINNPLGFVHSNLTSLQEYLADLMRLVDCLAPAEGPPDTEGALRALGEMNLELLRTDLPQCLRETQDGIRRIVQIVTDLRTFAREDSNLMENADLNQIMDGAVNILWNQIKYKAEVKREYQPLPAVMCFPSQMGQVFINLLSNAVQAIEHDGCIRLRSSSSGGFVRFEIEDNGRGMSPEVRARIFDPFFTTKPRGVGTGLGLKIVRKILKRHGGRIGFASEPGKGTTFWVELPVTPPGGGNEVS